MAKEIMTATDPGEVLVDFLIPRKGPEDRAVFLGVNGESIRVLPGVPVRVKRKFVLVWENAQKQEMESWRAQERMQQASRRALADL